MKIKLHYGGEEVDFEESDILSPGKHYDRLCSITSDINEHLPILKKYAEQCEVVSEMGVRYACSTWAFIESRPKKLICYDIDYSPFQPSEVYIRKICDNYNIKFDFILSDSLKVDIYKTDLLFIDTLHTYNQLYCELKKHSNNVNKWIILHDTTFYGERDEFIYDHASDLVKGKKCNKIGLNDAINDFIIESKNWIIKEVYINNNGLTVLEKINKNDE